MGIIKEFKEFAMKGNVVDLAVGVIIGAAFGKVVTSLVADVLTPPLGLLINRVDFKDLKWALHTPLDAKDKAVTINYGNFLQSLFDFLIAAFAIFVVVKIINTLRRKPDPAPAVPPAPSAEVKLLTEIRDALTQRR